MSLKDFKDLIAWQKAMDLVERVYKATVKYPKEECYGLTSQTRRAAVSIPSNIAEGQGRQTTKDFVHFLSIAYGSLREVETQLVIASRLNYITTDMLQGLLDRAGEVGRLVNGLSQSLSEGGDR